MKVKVQANKLENASVQYISLVERGANRIPFRIVKTDKESQMGIDLGKLFKIGKKEAAAPAIVGIAVAKGDTLALVTEAIAKAGFKVDQVQDADTAVIYKQVEGDVDTKECTAIKMDGEVAILMKGFDPSNPDLATFEEVIKAQGFIPSVSVAFDSLRTLMAEALYTAPEGGIDAVVSKIDEALNGFTAYVSAQARMIPSAAFKMEKEVVEVLKGYKKPAAEDEMSEEDKAKAKAKKEAEEKAAIEAEEKRKKAEADAKAGEMTGEKVAVIAKGAVEEGVKELATALKGVTEGMAALTTQMTAVTKGQEALTTKVAEVEAVAKAAKGAVKGVVLGGAQAGDHQELGTTVVKTDEDPRSGLFDTAFLPRKKTGERVKH